MSDPLALISVLAGVISLSGTVISKSVSLGDTIDLLRARWRRKVKRLEPYELSGVMYILFSPITDTLTTIEKNVLQGKNETVLDYRARRMAGCSMTGVAAALVAQVTNTSLQKDYTNDLPWIVRALWTCGLAFSLLSAYYSFLLHQYLTSFSTAQDIRHAFTHRTFHRGKTQDVKLPSLTVAVKLCLPPYLVSLAIGCYIFTLGLYWGFSWTQWWRVTNEPEQGVENRNVFILYILAIVIATVLFTIPSAIGVILQDLDSLHLYREELGHVCRPGNVENGQRTDGRAESERTLDGDNNRSGSSESPRIHDPETFSSVTSTYSLPIDIAASAIREPLRGVGATVAVLLEAAEAHRSAGVASQNVAAELERLVDGLAERASGRKGGSSENT